MSDTWVGPGWWLASDGRWYPPQTEDTHAAAVDAVVAHRVADEPFVLDLRHSAPIVIPSRSATPPSDPPETVVPPPVEDTTVPPVARRVRMTRTEERWGGHRRLARPVRAKPTQ